MPSLIDAIKKQKSAAKENMAKDVRKAFEEPNAGTFSRIANNVPYYFSESEETRLLKSMYMLLKSFELTPSKNADSQNMEELSQRSINDMMQSALVEKLITKQGRKELTPEEYKIASNPPDSPELYLEVHQNSVAKFKEFYIQFIKQVAAQVLIFSPKDNQYILRPELIDAMGLEPLISKLNQDEREEFKIRFILSAANNLFFNLFENLKNKLSSYDKDFDFQARYMITNNLTVAVTRDEEFSKKRIDEFMSAAVLPVEYVMNYVVNCKHDVDLLNKIMKDPFYGKEIQTMDTAKHRNKMVTLFAKTQKSHEQGDKIFQYVAIHYPQIANQIYNDALQYKHDGEMSNQFVYALKALVRLGKPELAYQALYDCEAKDVPANKEKVIKAVKEKAIKEYMKSEAVASNSPHRSKS